MYIDVTSFHTMSLRCHINVHYLDIIFWLTGNRNNEGFTTKVYVKYKVICFNVLTIKFLKCKINASSLMSHQCFDIKIRDSAS